MMRRSLPFVLVAVGLGLLYPLQRWIDSETLGEVVGEETLYFASGETIKRMSVGLHGIVADVYWIRVLQYFGGKLQTTGKPLSPDTSKIRMDLLAPLLKIVVTLDPGHIPAYRFGAIFLPERDLSAAIGLLEKGIAENPSEWRLYQDIGFIHWQAGNYPKASEYYERGGEIEGAAWWMRDLGGVMKIKGGSREVARDIYAQYLESEDENIRNQATLRLRQLNMLDELDAINGLLTRYKEETGECPASLRLLAPRLQSMGLTLNGAREPVDPHDFPYVLDPAKCTASQHRESTVPRS
jgi:hypothetical protein